MSRGMKPDMKLGVVLLAAGRSSRFGENKLLAAFDGRPMVCRAMDAAKAVHACRTTVVTGNRDIARLAQEYGYSVLENHEPELGQSHSICLGVDAMQDMDALLLMVCDQPGLSGASLAHLLEAFSQSDKGIACLCDQSHMGNPAVFAQEYYPALLALCGDRGAKGILRAHEDDLLVVPALDENELSDADTPEALEAMRAGIHN